MPARIGIDTGGTFTDVVRLQGRSVRVHKVPSTPDDPGRAVLAGLAAVRRRPDEEVDLVHGSTVGLNAVLQGRLPRTAFVTNRGFIDLIEIGRQARTDLYALEPDRAQPPVPRELRVEVDCRRGPGGRIERALDQAAIDATVRRLRRLRPRAVAIGLLHSPAAPADELRLARAIRRALPDVAVTCSAELWPGFGEYERFCAAILNAAITPLVGEYTAGIRRGMGPGRMHLLRSSLGALPQSEAARFPARAMFSGPAGGVLATARLGAAARLPRVAAFDMGGTSTDVCLVHEGQLVSDDGDIAGLPLPLPAVAVHTVGCGGGSLAWRDAGGALRTGPESAGAVPGPACYGVGDEPTVTDAHVALGHIGAETLLGGGFPIDPDRSVRAIEKLAGRLGLTTARTAAGILEVADVGMARALMRITVERAVDSATVPLVAYGGAGGLHAASLAAMLGMPCAVAPAHAGAFSALGLALAGESRELVAARRELLDDRTEPALRRAAQELWRRAAADLPAPVAASTAVMLRYAGQGGGLRLPLSLRATRGRPRRSLSQAFAVEHHRRFGFTPEAPIEVVQLIARAETTGRPFPRLTADAAPARPGGRQPTAATRRAPLGRAVVAVHSREALPIGARVEGPCLVEELTAVTRVPAGWGAEVSPLGLWLRRMPH